MAPSDPPPAVGPGPSKAFVVMSLFARAHVWASAIAGAVVCALVVFLATLILVLKGAPPGVEIGSNLRALALFWPGYEITLSGSLIGAVYAGFAGFFFGFLIALAWNLAHLIVVGAATVGQDWLEKSK